MGRKDQYSTNNVNPKKAWESPLMALSRAGGEGLLLRGHPGQLLLSINPEFLGFFHSISTDLFFPWVCREHGWGLIILFFF